MFDFLAHWNWILCDHSGDPIRLTIRICRREQLVQLP